MKEGVKDLVTRPDLSRAARHRSDPADFKMAAIQVTAKQRPAAGKRASSLTPKHTGLFCSYAVCCSQRAGESLRLVRALLFRAVKHSRFGMLHFIVAHLDERIKISIQITGCVIVKKYCRAFGWNNKLFCHTGRHFGGSAQIVSPLRKSGRGELGNCWSHRFLKLSRWDRLRKVVTRVVRPPTT